MQTPTAGRVRRRGTVNIGVGCSEEEAETVLGISVFITRSVRTTAAEALKYQINQILDLSQQIKVGYVYRRNFSGNSIFFLPHTYQHSFR